MKKCGKLTISIEKPIALFELKLQFGFLKTASVTSLGRFSHLTATPYICKSITMELKCGNHSRILHIQINTRLKFQQFICILKRCLVVMPPLHNVQEKGAYRNDHIYLSVRVLVHLSVGPKLSPPEQLGDF
jgi:hypothetical protein